MPAFTRKPVYGYRMSVYCLWAVGALSMVVWGHHMFVSGMSPFTGEYFSLVTLTITVPMTIFGVNMLASLWGAKLELKTPMLFVCGVIALFGSGGLGGLFLGNATADMQLHDTYFVVGHFHMMIGGVTLLATFAAIYFWFPKMFGRMMNETLGKAHFWLTFAPFFTIFFMQHFLGLQGAPRRYYAFTAFDYLQKTRGQNLVISLVRVPAGVVAVPVHRELRLEPRERTCRRRESLEERRRSSGRCRRRRRTAISTRCRRSSGGRTNTACPRRTAISPFRR